MSGPPAADARGQQRAALMSVAAAAALIALKLVTGLVTGSLGLIAEAAHSGTDLVAALLTLFAIRVAVRPADREHNYGHGKAEHLAALGESSFLFVVSAFLGYLAIHRLATDVHHHVDAKWWSFGVLAVVIAVDATRATVSLRASRRYHSPALASNALHFASDLAGSIAVLVGLVFVASGEPAGDAIAALVVAVIVMAAAARMARASADVLMDRASADAEDAVHRAVATLGGGIEVRRVRARQAAGKDFVDLVVGISPDAGLTQAHTTADEIEDAVGDELPGADVVVHVEPTASRGDLRERATVAALSVPEVREVHNVRAMHVGSAYELSLHVKLPRGMSLGSAHETVERLEAAILAAVPEVTTVHTHIEPLSQVDWASMPQHDEVAEARRAIDEIVQRHTGQPPTEVQFRDGERGRVALISILLPADEPLPSAHRRAGAIEEALRERCPELAEVVVHTEPISAP
jgi:cation diffusion facilitator family transporter